MDKQIVLLGYTHQSHTNWYPWNRFSNTFDELGLNFTWTEIFNFKRQPNKSYIFICWNMPDVLELIQKNILTKDDIVYQKVTSMTGRDYNVSWGNDPHSFYKMWDWTAYQMCVDVLEQGYNLYAFGCKTSYDDYPKKRELVRKLGKRLIMIPWSTCMFSFDDLQKQKPITSDFKYDSCFVGSIWGKVGRGNIDSIQEYLLPILSKSENFYLAGMGTQNGAISNESHIKHIKESKLCPIINAPSWRAERGVQDRFWTVFASGRFGVADTEGVYDFYDKDEVVCAIDPEEYIDKSLYYMKNVSKQLPFIEKIQKRIKQEYNWNSNFKKIFDTIGII